LALAARADAAIGNGLERAVRVKHRLRLRRLGQHGVLTEGGADWWAAGTPAPRDGCRLEVLIDGSSAFPRIADAIRDAERYVHVTGWHVDPGFELVRGDPPVALGALLAEVAERVDVRVLVWAGAPVPLFHPTRAEVSDTVRELVRDTRIRCQADPREHPFHCHHEKTVVVDGEVAFVGGIDMTALAGDRFDSSAHQARRRLGWHDVTTRLRGPAVLDVDEHFRMRWQELTDERLPPGPEPRPAGVHTVQIVRTVAEDMYDAVARGEFRILQSYLRAIGNAERYIYLENQFLWSPEIVAALVHKLQDTPSADFRIVVLLPARANNGQDDTAGQLGVLLEADSGHRRVLALTLRSLSGRRADPLYVHAKVAIVDDRWLSVGSANLNAHSLMNDTEMNVITDDRALARETRLRLWAEHLAIDVGAIDELDPVTVVDEHLRPVAAEQLARRRAGMSPTHHLLELPGVSRRSRRLLGPLVGLLDDG
jgi:phosphatidylserine/phosphatidylglycerophosphate/cardiolipin synthase-like enzyme